MPARLGMRTSARVQLMLVWLLLHDGLSRTAPADPVKSCGPPGNTPAQLVTGRIDPPADHGVAHQGGRRWVLYSHGVEKRGVELNDEGATILAQGVIQNSR